MAECRCPYAALVSYKNPPPLEVKEWLSQGAILSHEKPYEIAIIPHFLLIRWYMGFPSSTSSEAQLIFSYLLNKFACMGPVYNVVDATVSHSSSEGRKSLCGQELGGRNDGRSTATA